MGLTIAAEAARNYREVLSVFFLHVPGPRLDNWFLISGPDLGCKGSICCCFLGGLHQQVLGPSCECLRFQARRRPRPNLAPFGRSRSRILGGCIGLAYAIQGRISTGRTIRDPRSRSLGCMPMEEKVRNPMPLSWLFTGEIHGICCVAVKSGYRNLYCCHGVVFYCLCCHKVPIQSTLTPKLWAECTLAIETLCTGGTCAGIAA